MKTQKEAGTHTIFLHIPKAAGSTLLAILQRYYSPQETFEIVGSRLEETMGAFKALSPERRAEIKLLMGHMPFGLHEHLPQPTYYITMLRHPVQRIISHYNYVRRQSDHYLQEIVRSKNMDLEEYVASGISTEMDNGQVRLLTGHIDDIPFGKCPDNLLDEAKANLQDHFLVVGLSERFDESLLLMKQRLGWKSLPLYEEKNVAPRRSAGKVIPEQARRVIEKHNELDIALHQWASGRLDTELRGAHLEWQLTVFGALSRLYQYYGWLKATPKRTLKRIGHVRRLMSS